MTSTWIDGRRVDFAPYDPPRPWSCAAGCGNLGHGWIGRVRAGLHVRRTHHRVERRLGMVVR